MSRKWVLNVVFILGFLILCYPLVGSKMQANAQKESVDVYNSEVSSKSEEEVANVISNAKEYNDMLFQCQGAIVDNANTGILSDESYNSQLTQSDTGVMGSIAIPKIDVNLPIFHGTSDDVLSTGVGHQQGTSLPIGGENTHSCLTGHRGIPGSKLFTRLDELVENDLFFISVMGDTLAYKIVSVEVLTPEEAAVAVTDIKPGKDEVSLVTCTPYGINTHRLVVTGERVPYEKATYDSIKSGLPSLREIAFMVLPFVLLFIMVIVKIRDWRKSKREKEKVSK